jgi:energy-coupling factor transporter ATP-binding protein EcfA2
MSLIERIEVLAQMKAGGAFKNYIDYVRFPRFRSLEANARLDFGFPLTMLVGPNGCGKSSALQALYGVPKGRSVGTYWFTTAIDPIVDLDPEDRHCLIYSCNGGGRNKEVLKTRINKAGQPDLWDTSQPIARYDMKMGVRNAPIEKPVQYINFRAVQNAFEKRFHSERPPRPGTQQYLRYRSQYLRSVLRGATRLGRFWRSTRNPFDGPVALTPPELDAMNRILGRTYLSAKIIKHRLYEFWGYSVLLETSVGSYSEAFAGSGETAVALLVHEVIGAPYCCLMNLKPRCIPARNAQFWNFWSSNASTTIIRSW